MAEGENKKPVVEMSIWFIILIVVVIIATAWIIALNGKVKKLENEYMACQTELKAKTEESSQRAQLILDLAVLANDGNLSKNSLLDKIDKAGINLDELSAALETPSGDTLSGEAVSGEVAK